MNKQLKFIHITKCAGTSIEDAAKLKNIYFGRFHEEYGYWHRPFIELNQNIVDKYDWFMVVRNPYDRILSEYFCKWGGIGNTRKKHSIEQMNKYLIDKINNRDNKEIYVHKGHYTEQYKYLHPTTKIYIIKFENLDEEFNKLMNLYNIKDIKLKKINSSHKTFSIANFSKELIDLINDVYSKDFECFNYEKISV